MTELFDDIPDIANRRLTARNTSADIGRVLLEGIVGDLQLAKSALHYMGQRLYDDPSKSQIIQEYLLLAGNAAHKTTPEHVGAYIRIKEEMLAKGKTSHPEFKALLENILLGRPLNDDTLLTHLVDELSDMYQGILMGGVNDEIPERTHDAVFIPAVVQNATDLLLTHFPLLRRVTVRNYEDITAAVALDGIAQRLDPEYKTQVREAIEQDINYEGPKLCASELLIQAKLAYIVSKGVAVQAPYISRKHWSDRDLEATLTSAVASVKKKSFTRSFEEDVHEDLYFRFAYRDRGMYIRYQQLRSERFEDHPLYDDSDVNNQISNILAASPRSLRSGEQALVKKLLHGCEAKRVSTYCWKEFFTMHEELLTPTLLLLAYGARMDIATMQNDDEPPVLQNVNLHNFTILSDPDSSLNKPFSFSVNDFDGVVEGLLVTYTNNVLLPKIKDTYCETQWHSPVLFHEDYAPSDRAAARELLDHYPVFSRVPPINSDDIMSGMVLQLLQQYTGKTVLDTTATLEQNLFLLQLWSMGGRQ